MGIATEAHLKNPVARDVVSRARELYLEATSKAATERAEEFDREVAAAKALLDGERPLTLAQFLNEWGPEGLRRVAFITKLSAALRTVGWRAERDAVISAKNEIRQVSDVLLAWAANPGRPGRSEEEIQRACRAAEEYFRAKEGATKNKRTFLFLSRQEALAKAHRVSRNLLQEAIAKGETVRRRQQESQRDWSNAVSFPDSLQIYSAFVLESMPNIVSVAQKKRGPLYHASRNAFPLSDLHFGQSKKQKPRPESRKVPARKHR
jgi:hypothetical protein